MPGFGPVPGTIPQPYAHAIIPVKQFSPTYNFTPFTGGLNATYSRPPSSGGYGGFGYAPPVGAQVRTRGGVGAPTFSLPGFAGPVGAQVVSRGRKPLAAQAETPDQQSGGLADYQFDPDIIKRELVRRGLLSGSIGPGQLTELYRLGAQINAQGGLAAYNQAATAVPQSVVDMLRQRSLIG